MEGYGRLDGRVWVSRWKGDRVWVSRWKGD